MGRAFAQIETAAWAAVVLLAPAVSRACAVCTAGRDEENAAAFLMTTVFMSLMPLAAIGTLIFVLWRRAQKLEQARREANAERTVEAGPGVSAPKQASAALGLPSR
jgi:hypothetical protein